MRSYYVYMVECADGSYYIGVTNDYEKRIAEHNDGMDEKSYTFKRRPVRLVYLADFSEVSQAIFWEKQIKRWSREKKEALIRGEFEGLPELAECRNATHHSYYSTIACHTERSRCATRGLLDAVVSIPRLRSG